MGLNKKKVLGIIFDVVFFIIIIFTAIFLPLYYRTGGPAIEEVMNIKVENIEWEVLVDVGHGIVQFLIQNSNRIPDAVFLTHPHIDHTLGLDWVVQSHYRKSKTKYPVYATRYCWQHVVQSFPHLEEMVEFKELIYGESVSLFGEINVNPFPSYHGKYAFGATMFLFEISNKKVLITGDILLPVLRKNDKELLKNIELLIIDANNRFPYPKCNHWSITTKHGMRYIQRTLI